MYEANLIINFSDGSFSGAHRYGEDKDSLIENLGMLVKAEYRLFQNDPVKRVVSHKISVEESII